MTVNVLSGPLAFEESEEDDEPVELDVMLAEDEVIPVGPKVTVDRGVTDELLVELSVGGV